MISPGPRIIASYLGTFLRALVLTWASMLILVAIVALSMMMEGGWMSLLLVIGLGAGALARRTGPDLEDRVPSAEMIRYPVVKLDLPEPSPLWDRELDGCSNPPIVLRLDS
jgi:hypothetical protein